MIFQLEHNITKSKYWLSRGYFGIKYFFKYIDLYDRFLSIFRLYD